MKEIASYIISSETLLIVPVMQDKILKSKVFEYDEEFIVNMSPLDIVKDSCLFFGSSFDGRKEGTKTLIECEIKVPILIEDSRNLIFFPTSSYKNSKNSWISYTNLLKYSKYDSATTLLNFKGNNDIKLGVKYNFIDNQIIRCIKLDAIISKRKMIKLGQ